MFRRTAAHATQGHHWSRGEWIIPVVVLSCELIIVVKPANSVVCCQVGELRPAQMYVGWVCSTAAGGRGPRVAGGHEMFLVTRDREEQSARQPFSRAVPIFSRRMQHGSFYNHSGLRRAYSPAHSHSHPSMVLFCAPVYLSFNTKTIMLLSLPSPVSLHIR